MLTGSWAEVERLLGDLGSRLRAEAGKATAENLQLIEKTVVRHLDRQDLPWPPLSPAYRRYKERTRSPRWRQRRLRSGRSNPRSLSEKTLIATGAMRNAITSYQTGPYSGEVGISRQESYAAGEKLVNVAWVHERGSRDKTIPARPLWEPTAEELQAKLARRYAGALRRALDV